MKRIIVDVLLTLGLTFGVVADASAVTDGRLDGSDHPFVGLMVAQDDQGEPLWRCSGTLLSSTVFLTAGHCAEAPAAHVEIWFDTDVESGIPGNGYPFIGDVGGTPHTHPDYDPGAFFLHDVAVVVLDDPMAMSAYGTLPDADDYDGFKTKRGLQHVWFASVGYGLQMSFPDAASWKENNERVRYVAEPKLIQIDAPGFTGDFSMLLSNNANTGGTCFGDSGGPNFLRDTHEVAGITSYAINGNCAGTGGVFRTDRADVLAFIHGFLF